MELLDDVFELLTKERRRFVLYYLEEQDGPVRVGDVAEKIEEWESESPPSEPPDEKYENIVITLTHRHLPKAAEVKFIDYDREENIIELTGSPSEFNVILSVAEAIEQPGEDDVLTLL